MKKRDGVVLLVLVVIIFFIGAWVFLDSGLLRQSPEFTKVIVDRAFVDNGDGTTTVTLTIWEEGEIRSYYGHENSPEIISRFPIFEIDGGEIEYKTYSKFSEGSNEFEFVVLFPESEGPIIIDYVTSSSANPERFNGMITLSNGREVAF